MSNEQLTELVQRLRTYATSAPTLSSKLSTDSNNAHPRKRQLSAAAAKRKALLEEI